MSTIFHLNCKSWDIGGWIARPGETIVLSEPNADLTEMCWLLDDPPKPGERVPSGPMRQGWIELKRSPSGGVEVVAKPSDIRWAYRLRFPDGTVKILGDEMLWSQWQEMQSYERRLAGF